MKILGLGFIIIGLAAACFAAAPERRYPPAWLCERGILSERVCSDGLDTVVGDVTPEQEALIRQLIDSPENPWNGPDGGMQGAGGQCLPGCSITCPPCKPDAPPASCSVSAPPGQGAYCSCSGCEAICYTRTCR